MADKKHWRSMAALAWGDAAKAVGLETRERVIVALLIQALIGVGIFLWATSPDDGLLGRALTAAAPFAVFPVLFAWKWLSLPPRMEEERLRQGGTARIANPHDMSMEAALEFIASKIASEKETFGPRIEAITQIEQFFSNGLMRCWGMRQRNYGPHHIVPEDHWRTHRLEPLDFLDGNYRTSSNGGWSADAFYNLMVNRDEVERADWKAYVPRIDPRDDLRKYMSFSDSGSPSFPEKCAICGAGRHLISKTAAKYECGAHLSKIMPREWAVLMPCSRRPS